MIKATFDSYMEFTEKERAEMEKINHPKIKVCWHGELSAEVDEFDSLSDAALFSALVDGIILDERVNA